MNEIEEKTPVPPEGSKSATFAWTLRTLAKYLLPILLAVATFISAVKVGDQTSKEASKDAVDTSLQATKKPVDELQAERDAVRSRLAVLEAEVLRLGALMRNAHMSVAKRRKAEAEAAAVAAEKIARTPPAPELTPVPDSLDKAQAQQNGAAK